LFCLFVGRRFQAFVDDDGERDVVQIRCLNFQVTDELVFERVFGRSVEHLLLDVGLVGTKDDEGEFVAMSAFRRHVPDVEAGVAAVAVLLDLLEVIPERSVVALGGGSVLASGVVEHLIDDDVFQIVTEFVNAVFVFSLLLHRFVRVDALIRHLDSGRGHIGYCCCWAWKTLKRKFTRWLVGVFFLEDLFFY